MKFSACHVVIAGLCVVMSGTNCETVVEQSEDGSTGSFSFSTPTLNDEEAHSTHMPTHLKCDACTAITYQFKTAFDDYHKKRKSVKVIPETVVDDLVEGVCFGKEMEKYGVKEVNKVKRLSGPGLEAEQSPGIMAGGGRWPERMKRMCNLYVEEFEEYGIYKAYQSDKEDNLFNTLCRSNVHPLLTDVCVGTTNRRKTEL